MPLPFTSPELTLSAVVVRCNLHLLHWWQRWLYIQGFLIPPYRNGYHKCLDAKALLLADGVKCDVLLTALDDDAFRAVDALGL